MDVEDQLADDKPMEDVLNRVLKSSPTLARIFGRGGRLQNPFKPDHVRKTEKPFQGKPNPTYFRFAGKAQGEVLERQAYWRRRVRLDFETDVENEYFTRKVDRGCKRFQHLSNGERDPILDYVGPNLVDGKGSVTFELPDTVEVGDTIEVEFTVSDPVTGHEFSNRARLSVLPAVDTTSGSTSRSRNRPSRTAGKEVQGNAGIAFPKVHWLEQRQEGWKTHFSELDDCLDVIDDGAEVEGQYEPDYTFYLNADNTALKTELTSTKLQADIVRKQFEIGVVLIAMALIHDDRQRKMNSKNTENDAGDSSQDDISVEDRAGRFIRAVAPVIVPMIQNLGALAEEEADSSNLVGQAV